MTIRVIALALWCSTVGASQPAAERVAEQTLAIVLDAPDAANQVWPRFTLPSRSFAIYTATGTYLHTPGAAPEGFAQKGRWWFKAGAPGDLSVTAVPASSSASATARTLYHEAFHAFQREHPGRLLPPDPRSEPFTREQAASIEVERRVLAQALRYPNRARQYLLDALALRHERTSANGASLAAAERYAEWHEGLAEYVGELSTARALGRTVETARAAVRGSLGVRLSTFGGSPAERLIRARSHGTGAALGLLLDALAVDWQSRAFDVSLDELAAQAAGLRDDQVSTLARQARARHDYATLLASPTPPWGPLSVKIEDTSYNTP
jgi:hypothetical protein